MRKKANSSWEASWDEFRNTGKCSGHAYWKGTEIEAFALTNVSCGSFVVAVWRSLYCDRSRLHAYDNFFSQYTYQFSRKNSILLSILWLKIVVEKSILSPVKLLKLFFSLLFIVEINATNILSLLFCLCSVQLVNIVI